MSTKNAVVTTAQEKLLTLPAGMEGLFDLKENMQGVVPRLPQIGIIHQGQMFKMPDGSKCAEFTAIMLHKSFTNAYWSKSFDQSGGGNPPDCSSLDAVTPDYNSEAVQAEKCSVCEKNKFGSDGARGKACKNMMRVHLLLEGDSTPYRLTLPPSNLRAMGDYISSLSLQGLPFQLVYTKFRLKAEQNKDGIEFSDVVLEPVGVIQDRETAEGIKKLIAQWKPAFIQTIGSDEY